MVLSFKLDNQLFFISICPFNAGTEISVTCAEIFAKYSCTIDKTTTKCRQSLPYQYAEIYKNNFPKKFVKYKLDWLPDNI